MRAIRSRGSRSAILAFAAKAGRRPALAVVMLRDILAMRRRNHRSTLHGRASGRLEWREKLRQSGHATSRRNWTAGQRVRSEEHTSELQSLMRISYAVFCLKKKNTTIHIYQKIVTEI